MVYTEPSFVCLDNTLDIFQLSCNSLLHLRDFCAILDDCPNGLILHTCYFLLLFTVSVRTVSQGHSGMYVDYERNLDGLKA